MLALAVLGFRGNGYANTVISVAPASTAFAAGANALSSSWTQTGSYSNVTVSAVLTNLSGIGLSFGYHAFLTNSLGPGTTVANEIANTAITLAPGLDQSIALFSGLSLGSGTYFLVITPDGGPNGATGWSDVTSAPVVTLDAGVTHGTDRFSTSNIGYAPSRTFNTLPGNSRLLYSVEADPVPEPATTALLGAGLVLMLLKARRLR